MLRKFSRRTFLRGAALALGAVYLPSYTPRVRADDSGNLQGRVSQLATGEPISGAVVRVNDTLALADEKGRYALALEAGVYDVYVEAEGYLPMSRRAECVPTTGTLTLDLAMIPTDPSPEEVALLDAWLLQRPRGDDQGLDTEEAFDLLATQGVPTTVRLLMLDGSVTTLAMDEYLKGVVPWEIGAYKPAEALRAQAVAARCYAATAHRHLDVGADLCTTTHCQYWKNQWYSSTNQAVEDTHGIVATYNRSIISAFYFGHCNGATRNNEDVWTGGTPLPYCRAVSCPCGNTEYWGHGVGMCQEGAIVLADTSGAYGYDYGSILRHYYTGVALEAPIRIASPADDATVRGVLAVQVESSRAPSRVDCYIDDTWKTWTTASTFVWKFSTLGLSDGEHQLRVVATTELGESYDEIGVVVDNTPPSGQVSAPTWSCSEAVPFQFSGLQGVTRVQFSDGWIWEAENLAHQTGTGELVSDSAAGNGWAWRGRATHSSGYWYGPYFCGLPSGDYQASFRMKTPDRLVQSVLGTLDVSDRGGTNIYASYALCGEDFAADDTYEEQLLSFSYSSSGTCQEGSSAGIEFRVLFRATGELSFDRVRVFSAPHSIAPAMTWELVAVEGAHDVVVRLLDEAGNWVERTLTVGLDYTAPTWLQMDATTAVVQDSLSGLDPTSAAWAESYDGGKTWGAWQSLSLAIAAGSTEAVTLRPPSGSAPDVRYRIADQVGNTTISRLAHQWLPLVQRGS